MATSTSDSAQPIIYQTVINNSTTTGITTDELNTRLATLSQSLEQRITAATAHNFLFSGPSASTPATTQALALTNKIDQLSGITISNSTIDTSSIPDISGSYLSIAGGSLTGALTGTSLTLSSALDVASGGTGWASFLSGYVPFGNGSSALATSSSLYFDSVNGRLGIGTTSPTRILGLTADSIAVHPSVTYTVCASTARGKDACDYVADGTADDVEIQAAVDAASSEGGIISLSEGDYSLSSGITIPGNTSITFQGQGKSTLLRPQEGVDAVTVGGSTNTQGGIVVKDIYVRGSATDEGDAFDSGTAITLTNHTGAIVEDIEIIRGTGGILIQATDASGSSRYAYNIVIDKAIIEKSEGYGIKLLNPSNTDSNFVNSVKISNSRIAHNTVGVQMVNQGNGETAGNLVANSWIETGTASDVLVDLDDSDNNMFYGVIFDGISGNNMITIDTSSTNNRFETTSFDTDIVDLGTDNMFVSNEASWVSGANHLQYNNKQNLDLWGNYDHSTTEDTAFFEIKRNSLADGNSSLRMYITQYENAWITSLGTNLILNAPEDRFVSLAPAGDDNISFFVNPTNSKDPVVHIFSNLDGIGSKYVQLQLNEATTNFELSREDSNIGEFDVQMPLRASQAQVRKDAGYGTANDDTYLYLGPNNSANDEGYAKGYAFNVETGSASNVNSKLKIETYKGWLSGDSSYAMPTTTLTTLMTLDGGGNVGIGTTSPTTALQVDGTITPNTDNSGTIGNATYRWNAVYATNGTIQTSDERLKKDIAALSASSSLSQLLALNPVSFLWKDTTAGTSTQLGFVAQQVQQILPDVVSIGADPSHTLGLRYTAFIPVIISAMQTMYHELMNLTQTVTGFASSFTTTELHYTRATGDELCLRDSSGTPVCINGDSLKALVSGQVAAASGSSITPTEPPTIEINGNNPAKIDIGTTYNDLGATITGPTDADRNLGISVFVSTTPIEFANIDTSTSTTYHINYVATNGYGTSTSTRTIIVGNVTTTNATSTPANDITRSDLVEEAATTTDTTEVTHTPEAAETDTPDDTATTTTPSIGNTGASAAS